MTEFEDCMFFKKTISGPQTMMELEILTRWIMEAVDLYGWGPRDVYAINTSLVEAINNATEHGNKRDCQKTISFLTNINEKMVSITIRDDGHGFRPDILPDPRETDRILCPTGRGVFLIRYLMDKVLFNGIGNEITMEKYRSTSDDDEYREKLAPLICGNSF